MKRMFSTVTAGSAALLVVTGVGVSGTSAHAMAYGASRSVRPSRATASSALSNCSSACLSVWPALTAHGRPRARGRAVGSKIGTIPAHGGKRQVTYAGHPLYYYVGDRKPGDVNGQGLKQFGAEWYALSPAGRKIDNG